MKANALRSGDSRVGPSNPHMIKSQFNSLQQQRCSRCHVATPFRALMPIDHIKQCAVAAAGAILLFSSTPTPALAMCPDLIKAPDGLQYCDVKIGSGDPPVKGAFIKAHYNGRLDSDAASGTFDSSYERGRPLAFAVGTGQVIKGWDEGILGGEGVTGMLPGGKRQLIIPPALGYGDRAVGGGLIPANSTLYFDIELIGRLGKK
jgi:peptidylprolyl isomerase